MKYKILSSLFFAAFISMTVNGQQKATPDQTEYYSPVPKLVTPGAASYGAPSDAIILFDGKNTDEWESIKPSTTNEKWTLVDDAMMVNNKVGDLQTNLVTVERYRQDDGHSGSEDSDDLVDCDDVQDVSSEGFWDKLPVALALGAGDRGLFEEVSSTESSTWTTMPLPSDSLLDALIWSDLPGNAPAAASRRTAAATWLPRGVRDAGSSDLERVSGFAVLATAWLFIVRALRLVAHDACGTLP